MNSRFHPLVLCYHAVSDSWQHFLAVRPGDFEHQIRNLLRYGYRPVSAVEVLSNRRKLLHVTFDDAYLSIENVLPTLEKMRIPATVFACPDYADRGLPLAVPELARELDASPAELLTMDWDQLRSLTERNIEIGSHTLSHKHLTRLSDAELRRELQESRERLETAIDRPCRFLAYPYGEDDPRVHAAAQAAGYEAAFAAPGRERPVNVYALPRVGIWRTDRLSRALFKSSSVGRRLTRAFATLTG